MLGNLQERAGLGGITPAFSYHAPRDVFPHNPRAEGAAARPRRALLPARPLALRTACIQPRVDALGGEADVLGETCRTAAARGMRVDAWTIFLHADRADEQPGLRHRATPSATATRPTSARRTPTSRAYARALVADVAATTSASIFAESLHYHPVPSTATTTSATSSSSARRRATCSGSASASTAWRAAAPAASTAPPCRRRCATSSSACSPTRGAAVTGRARARPMLADVAGGELDAYLDVRAGTVTVARRRGDRGRGAAPASRFVFMDPSGAVKGYATGRPERRSGGRDRAGGSASTSTALGRVCPGFSVLAYAADVERVRLDLEAYRARARRRAPSRSCLRPLAARLRRRREPRREARARAGARAARACTSTTTASCGSRRST